MMLYGAIYEVVTALVGFINPVGETCTDDNRLENLKSECHLIDLLLEDIARVSGKRGAAEFSIKRAAEFAQTYLDSLEDYHSKDPSHE